MTGVGGASPQVQGDMLAPDSKEFADRLLVYEQVFIDDEPCYNLYCKVI